MIQGKPQAFMILRQGSISDGRLEGESSPIPELKEELPKIGLQQGFAYGVVGDLKRAAASETYKTILDKVKCIISREPDA
eukprot:CAMPEP_0183732106 /NCGR_PEP_ID=MMETSP0737-20130205/37534_1 /TAXON_ID=385413 /ORGANISM="Thalassiosira miniscula, Strain CCMP1093" /LENGTH=79 /DNA_ID=CAMNT_0025965025 /DNA_START=1345 /DNA_END=1584 /DNA_ORIENTATION=+